MGMRLKLPIAAGAVSLFALTQVLSASASAVAQAPEQSVIVVFKNQDPAQPATRSALGARRRTLAAVQGPVLGQLAAGNAHDVHSFTTLNAVSATVSPAQVSSLRSDPAVAEVVPNGLVHLAPPTTARRRRRLRRRHAAARRLCSRRQGPARARGAADDERRLRQPERQDGAVAGDQRQRGHRRLDRRRAGPEQSRLHPAQRQARVRRLQGLQRLRHVGADQRRGGVRRRLGDRRAGPPGLRRQPLQRAAAQPSVQHPRRGRRSRRQPRRSRRLRRLRRRAGLVDPRGDRLRDHDRPRQRPQRVLRDQQLSRRRRVARPDRAGQRPGGRGRDHGRRVDRRRRRDEHDRRGGDRPQRDLGRRLDRQPELHPGRLRRNPVPRGQGMDQRRDQLAELVGLRPARTHDRRRRAGRVRLGAVLDEPGRVRWLRQPGRQPVAGPVVRRDEPVLAADGGRRGARHPGVREDAPRDGALAGAWSSS